MPALEIAAISLGATIMRSACKIWLKDATFVTDLSVSAVDALEGNVRDRFERRKAARVIDDCADVVAKRLLRTLSTGFPHVSLHEREAAVYAVQDLFGAAGIGNQEILASDLDPELLRRRLDPSAKKILHRAQLGEGGEQVFAFLYRETCTYLVHAVSSLPDFQGNGITELLRRQTMVLDQLETILDRLPDRRGLHDIVAEYRRQVQAVLDRMEIFGARVRAPIRRYPLSVAYLRLSASSWSGEAKKAGHDAHPDASAEPGVVSVDSRVDELLARSRHLLLTGDAGSGKTTLLKWLAVQSARSGFEAPLDGWNDTVPFFIPLRRYAGIPLPSAGEFVAAIHRHLSDDLPSGWVASLLRDGRALVLVDGVDELHPRQRVTARNWLSELVTAFPLARYVVTSRPEAVDEDWLELTEFEIPEVSYRFDATRSIGILGMMRPAPAIDDASGTDPVGIRTRRHSGPPRFTLAQMRPMTPEDVRELIGQWHRAVGEQTSDQAERSELEDYQRAIVRALASDRHLRRLAVSPLLCAMLCALNRELRMQLPRSRMEVYEAALTMLLEQRDRERGVDQAQVTLSRTEKVIVLQEIALWLVRNGRSDASVPELVERVAAALGGLRRVDDLPDAEQVFAQLLDRSGVLREPTSGQIDFVHHTFQEYLAGKAAVDANMVGELINHAADDQWREVIVMAAGHAQPHQCRTLIEGILQLADASQSVRLRLLLAACLQTTPRLDPELRERVKEKVRDLVPPRSSAVAEVLAAAGDFVIDLLPPPEDQTELDATLQTASLIGGEDALALVERIAADPRWAYSTALFLRVWDRFDPRKYADGILRRFDLSAQVLRLRGLEGISLLGHLDTARSAHVLLDPRDQGPVGPVKSIPQLESISIELRNLEPTMRYAAGIQPESTESLAASLDWIRIEKDRAVSEQDFDRAAGLREAEILVTALQRLSGVFQVLSAGVLPKLQSLALVRFPLQRLPHLPPVATRVSRLHLERWHDLRSLDGIAEYPRLRHLEITDTPLEGVDLDPIVALPELRSLRLQGDASWRPALASIVRTPHLSDLFLGRCRIVDLAGLSSAARVRSQLLTIHVHPDQVLSGTEDLPERVRLVRDSSSERSLAQSDS